MRNGVDSFVTNFISSNMEVMDKVLGTFSQLYLTCLVDATTPLGAVLINQKN